MLQLSGYVCSFVEREWTLDDGKKGVTRKLSVVQPGEEPVTVEVGLSELERLSKDEQGALRTLGTGVTATVRPMLKQWKDKPGRIVLLATGLVVNGAA